MNGQILGKTFALRGLVFAKASSSPVGDLTTDIACTGQEVEQPGYHDWRSLVFPEGYQTWVLVGAKKMDHHRF
jgi:hypothetical protein